MKESLEFAQYFSSFIKLANVAGLDLDVSNCTVFAPDDNAFNRLPVGMLDFLMANPVEARAVAVRHILPNQVLTTKQIKSSGFWESIPGGALSYINMGPIIRIGNATIILEKSNNECDNGTIHTLDTVLKSPAVKAPSISQTYVPSIPAFGDSTVASLYPSGVDGVTQRRAIGACLPSTTGGRKAMGLMKQLPFYMYGPPFNAAKQEDIEPISIAQPECVGIDYQIMPPGSVIVEPDEVTGAKLLPVSGMSKYIGQTKRLVEGDGLSDYSRLD